MKTLLLVDIQRDLLPGGALPVPDGDEVVPVANTLMPLFDLVVASQDWHPANHISFASNHEGKKVGEEIEFDGRGQPLWPDHCIQGSPGACFAQNLDAATITETFRKGIDPRVDGHSAFLDNDRRRSTGLNEYLKARGCQWLDIMGLALDVCVRFTVLDALDLGYTPRLITDGCRGMGPAEETLEQLRAAGVEMTTSDKVIRELTNRPQETHL